MRDFLLIDWVVAVTLGWLAIGLIGIVVCQAGMSGTSKRSRW